LVLAALPATQAEICAKTGVSQAAVSRWVAYLRDCADAHIGSWQLSTNQGPAQAIYHPGAGADVLCTALTPRQLARNARPPRQPIDRSWMQQAPRRDALMSALFGGH